MYHGEMTNDVSSPNPGNLIRVGLALPRVCLREAAMETNHLLCSLPLFLHSLRVSCLINLSTANLC